MTETHDGYAAIRAALDPVSAAWAERVAELEAEREALLARCAAAEALVAAAERWGEARRAIAAIDDEAPSEGDGGWPMSAWLAHGERRGAACQREQVAFGQLVALLDAARPGAGATGEVG